MEEGGIMGVSSTDKSTSKIQLIKSEERPLGLTGRPVFTLARIISGC